MAELVDRVVDYFRALIMGVLLLYVLWEIILVVAADIPQFFKYGIAIAIAASGALLFIAKGGIKR